MRNEAYSSCSLAVLTTLSDKGASIRVLSHYPSPSIVRKTAHNTIIMSMFHSNSSVLELLLSWLCSLQYFLPIVCLFRHEVTKMEPILGLTTRDIRTALYVADNVV